MFNLLQKFDNKSFSGSITSLEDDILMNSTAEGSNSWITKNDLSDEDAETVDQDTSQSSDRENDRRASIELDTSQNTVSMYNKNTNARSVAFGQDLTVAAGTGRVDSRLPPHADDPRVRASRVPGDSKKVRAKGKGRNTESFDPKSTIVRPGWCCRVGLITICVCMLKIYV